MEMNRLTEKSREALSQAQSVATRLGQTEVDAAHLLFALLSQEGLVPRLIERAGADPGALRAAVERELARRPKVTASPRTRS